MVIALVQHTHQGERFGQEHVTYTVHIETSWNEKSPQALESSLKKKGVVSKVVHVIPWPAQGSLYNTDKVLLEAVIANLVTTAFNRGNVARIRESLPAAKN